MSKNVTIGGTNYTGITSMQAKVTDTNTFANFVDTDDATATASDIASGKTAFVKGNKITGTKVESGGGIVPTGTITITTNGTHDVTDYASALVNVVTTGNEGGGSSNLPAGLSGFSFGTFSVEEDVTSDDPVVVNHTLGSVPDVVVYGITTTGNYSSMSISDGVLYGIRQFRDGVNGTMIRVTNSIGGVTQAMTGVHSAAYGSYGGVLSATKTQITIGAMGSPKLAEDAGKTTSPKYLKAGYTYYWCAFKMEV